MLETTNRENAVHPWLGFLILIAAFLALYQPWRLGDREFFRMEGMYAAQTSEMDLHLPMTVAHGVAIRNAFPLYPLLGALLQRTSGLPVEFSLRLLSVLMTAFGAAAVYATVRQSQCSSAAQAATAMFIASNIMVEKSMNAYPVSTVAFGVLAAQQLWFFFGVRRANWNAAWIAAFAVLSLAFLAGGFLAIVLFLLPLAFMRRPLTLWPKLNKPGLAAGLALLLGTIVFWAIPYWVLSRWMPSQQQTFGGIDGVKYLKHLGYFPCEFLLRFAPWILVAWAPFCVALQSQDGTPIYSRYLRTIVVSTGFLLWLFPNTEASDLVFMTGPLAILTGLYYDSAVRRYAKPVRWLLRVCGFFSLLASFALVFFCIIPEGWIGSFIELSQPLTYRSGLWYWIESFTEAAIALAVAMVILSGSRRNPVWVMLLLSCVCGAFFFWQVMEPYRSQDRSKHAIAREMRTALIADFGHPEQRPLVYKSDILDLYGECHYAGFKVQKINRLDQLPRAAQTVYLLSTEFPQAPDRNWINLLPPGRVYLKHRLCLWKGMLRRERAEPAPLRPGGMS